MMEVRPLEAKIYRACLMTAALGIPTNDVDQDCEGRTEVTCGAAGEDVEESVLEVDVVLHSLRERTDGLRLTQLVHVSCARHTLRTGSSSSSDEGREAETSSIDEEGEYLGQRFGESRAVDDCSAAGY